MKRVVDATAGTPDVRWFTVAGGGVVASAMVHGNPPAGLAPTSCPGSTPPPVTVTLAVTVGTGDSLTLRAGGEHTEVAGFAARFADDPGRWHAITLTDAGTDVPWRAERSRGDVTVVAASCLGGQSPTDVLDARMVRGDRTVGDGPALTAAERATAARHACVYP